MRILITKQGLRLLGLLCGLGLVGSGCQTYEHQNKGLDSWRAGNVPGAIDHFTSKAESEKNSRDAVVWRLEQGAALRGAARYKESNDAFDQAEAKIDHYEQTGKVKVGREAIAMSVANQAILPYEGRAYDKIMLDTYKVLNDLQLGQVDKARVDLIRAYQRQQDAVFENARRIEKAKQEAETQSSESRELASRAENDNGFKSQLGEAYKSLDGLRSYGDYVNPFTIYLDGLFFMATATDGADLERARKSFQRAQACAPDNKYIQQDISAVDGILAGHPMAPTTYVIFETGTAPVRGQIRIDIPLFIVGVRDVPYVGAAFPILKLQDEYVPTLQVSGGGVSENTALVSSMDSVIARDFKNDLPTIITKTLLSTTIKAASAYAINKSMEKQDPVAQILVKLAVAAYQVSINIADTRTWTTLPKEFQVCRIPTPADHRLDLSTGGMGRATVTLGDGAVNVVFVKSTSSYSPLQVSQIKLK